MGNLFAVQGEAVWLWYVAGLLTIPALIALNGFFVMAEFALVAVRKTRIEELVSRGIKGAARVQHAIEHLDHTIAATQLGITLSSIGLGWVAEVSLARSLETVFADLPAPWSLIAIHSVAGTLAFCVITFMHVVFGELFPKTVALQAPDRVALWIARPLGWFALVTRPILYLMNGTGNAIARLFGLHAPGDHVVHSVQELALLIEDTEEAGLLEPEQAQLVQNVFRLANKEVADCMVPRDRMASLELTASPDKILEAVRTGAHTRMPVYDGELDNIVGIVNTKDLFYLFSLKGVVVLEDAIYPALFLKPDESVANALQLFRKAKRPMALVRDENRKIHGLVTLEDILEEIIGDIEDEHDRPARKVKIIRRTKKLIKPTPGRLPTP